jgi:DNA-directed RNA polymerase subunit beta'
MLDNHHFKQFTDTLKRSEAVVKGLFPVKGPTKTLSVTNLRWTNVGPEVLFDVEKQKQAKLKEQSLNAVLVGDLKLTEEGTGKVLDQVTKYPLLAIPHLTMNAGYIVDGKERQVINQFRLRPGIYTRFTGDDNVEAFLNTTAIGTYKIILERSTGVIRMRVGSTATTPIYSVLLAVGMTDAEIRTLLGAELFAENKRAAKPEQDITKLLSRMRPYLVQPPELGAKSDLVRQYFESKPLDPAVNKVTIGKALDKIDKTALVEATKKVLKLSRGEAEPDDTESLAFKYILSIEDFVPERLEKAVEGLKFKLQGDLRRRDEIRLILPPNRLGDPVQSFFTTSEFTRYSDQHNPLDMAAVSSLTTTLGEGGISSSHAITDEIRTIHPSHYGLLDPMHTPEGQRVGVTSHLSLGARKKGQTLYVPVYDAKTGKRSEISVQDLDKATIAFPDQYDNLPDKPGVSVGGPPKTSKTRVKARSNNVFKEVLPKQVDYIYVSADSFFSSTTACIPFLPNNDANRVLMGDKHVEQSVNLLDPDAPLVQHRIRGKGYEEMFGERLVPRAVDPSTGKPVGGEVMEVTKNSITIKPTGGGRRRIKIPIHDHYPLNSRTFLHDRPIVKKGDTVKPGQALAINNFTKDGSLAIGKNLKVAYTAYKGYNFEDGVVISSGAAQKLTSVHKYEARVEKGTKVKIGADTYIAAYPAEMGSIRDRGKRYDASGIIKKGLTVEPGDNLIPAIQEVDIHPEYDYQKLHRSAGLRFLDISETWDHDFPGEIIDVVKTRTFIKVIVKSQEPMQVGDKLCFDPEHDVLTRTGWVPVAAVTEDDEVATLNPQSGELEYHRPTNVYRYDLENENLYELKSQQVDTLVTLNHRLYVQPRGREDFELIPAGEVRGKRVRFKKDAEWRGQTPSTVLGYETLDFMRFLGFYLAEGNLEKTDYRIIIHQTKPSGRAWFRELAGRLGLHLVIRPDRFIIYKKDLWQYLEPLGNRSWRKRLPTAVLEYGREAQRAVWEGFIEGDGNVTVSGQPVAFTTSPILRDQLQESALKAGWSANWKEQKDGEIGSTKVIEKTGQVLAKRRTCYQVRVIKAKNRPQINHGHVRTQNGQSERVVQYTGAVHCVTIPNHVIYVRRNGKPHWSGNSMRHGAKGIVVKILPDEEMYKDEDGTTIDVLLNPAGVPGRVNTGQMLETAAGKLALKTGKTYYTDNFNAKGSALTKLQKDLADAGINDEETITDPKSGHKLSRVLVGDAHIYKLTHQVSGKMKARASIGEPYSVDENPTKGSGSGAQRIGVLDTFSLLSGDATEFLNDAFGLKSQKNDEYWRALQLGQPLPPPKTPFIEEKFVAMLIGAGINLKQTGSRINAGPLTDEEIESMSNGAIERPVAVKASNLKPERGGLFDPAKTGGPGGNYWNHIELATDVVHPLMLNAAASVGNFNTRKELDQVIAGILAITEEGEITAPGTAGAVSGGEGVRRRLAKVDIDKAMTETAAIAATAKGAKLDKAHKRLRYLKALKSSGYTAEKAYINKKLPIIPAKFRQIAPMPDGSLSVADANHGYREVLLINEKIKQLQALGIDEENLRDLKKALADATAGLVGTAPPISRGKVFRGFVSQIHGPTPKSGLAQSKLMGRNQDLSGRSTVIPNPKLNMDEVGIPAGIAFKVYKPFIIKRLVEAGNRPLDARSMVEDQHPAALRALQVEAEDRPILMNRAPSLHKFNIQALKPRIIDGKAIEVNPLIVAGYNMDFDGDTAGLHVPVSEEARREALEKLLPSKNLFSPRAEFVVHAPTKETVLGVYLMTMPKGTPTKSFGSDQEMVRAYQAKQIAVNEAVRVQGAVTCAGQAIFSQAMPPGIRVERTVITSKVLDKLLLRIAKELGSERASQAISNIKDLGNHYVTEVGFSVSLKDLEINTTKRDAIMKSMKTRALTVGFDQAADEALDDIAALLALTEDNRFIEAGITSGALGSKGIHRMIASTVAVTDHKGKTIPIAVDKSYAEGHDLGTYLGTTPGARKGLIDKGLSVADTGYFSRMLVNTSIENQVSAADCGTKHGVDLPLESAELSSRYGAEGPYRNVIITADIARRLRSSGKRTIKVRSPLTCQAQKGVCQKCFGLLETGKAPRVGYHVGALAGQTLGEVATQLTLRSFHTGGAIGGSQLGFERIRQIMEMPQSIKGKAVLSQGTGVVTKVDSAPAGGYFVFVGQDKHYIPKELGVRVSRGDRVKAGDILSQHGVIKPQELLETTGDIHRVREHLISELDTNYRAAGKAVNRRIFETVVKPLTDRGTVTDVGDGARFFPVHSGEVLPINRVDEWNRKLTQLKLRPIKVEPMVLGIKQAPLLSEDFVGTLSHEKLKKTLSDAPSLGKSTDLLTGHPLARLSLTNLRSINAVKRPQGDRR